MNGQKGLNESAFIYLVIMLYRVGVYSLMGLLNRTTSVNDEEAARSDLASVPSTSCGAKNLNTLS